MSLGHYRSPSLYGRFFSVVNFVRLTIADRILELLAADRRVIAADWRFGVLYGRTARTHGFRPPDPHTIQRLIARLSSSGAIEPIDRLAGVFRITVPYASSLPAPDEAILAEANPKASLAFFSAISFHGLTIEYPADLHAISGPSQSARLPLGTATEDWIDVPEPRRRHPNSISDRQVYWTRVKAEWDFGVEVGFIEGIPIYVTTLEKTLVDSLRFPQKSGGTAVVIRAWREAEDRIRIKRVIEVVERYGQTLLRQRVGFMCEQLGLVAAEFTEWVKSARRGGSARLIASEPFSPCFSPKWCLSINVPVETLPRPEQVEEC